MYLNQDKLIVSCCYCNRLKYGDGKWSNTYYIFEVNDMSISHGVCIPCYDNVMYLIKNKYYTS